MRRRLFNVLLALSVLLGLATTVFWARSYVYFEGFHREVDGGKRGCSVKSERGTVWIMSIGGNDVWLAGRGWTWSSMSTAEQRRRASTQKIGLPPTSAGFVYLRAPAPPAPQAFLLIAFPYWLVVLVCLILPAIRGWQLTLADHRREQNLCVKCGYDLRASPERCPECGTAQADAHESADGR